MANISGGDGDPSRRGKLSWQDARRIFLTALIWVSAAFTVFLLWELRFALLIAFGAVLVAILLMALADLFRHWLRFPRAASLIAATVLVIAVLAAAGWLFGQQIYSQFGELLRNATSGVQQLRSYFVGSGMPEVGSRVEQTGSSLLTGVIGSVLSLGLGFIEAAVVVAIAGIYLAAQPKLYRWGIAVLFDPMQRARVLEVIELVETTVRLWLLGQMILMIIVGVLTYTALLFLGIPSPAALALIAGIAEIVPYLGPFISAVPALLVALTLGVWPAVWTACAYLVVHLVEGYIAAPLVERRFVTIPPALILFGLVAVQIVFGTGGILLAAPITVVLFVLVKMLYVEDPLEQKEHAHKHG
jgi:predicted PurR-regulated permease PerM